MNYKRLAWVMLPLALTACGEDDNKGKSNEHIKVANHVQDMSIQGCITESGVIKSQYATNDFMIGSPDDISEGKLKDIARAAQVAFDDQVTGLNIDRLDDLDFDPAVQRLEICVRKSEGTNGAALPIGILIGPGNSGGDLDFLLNHELVHTINFRMANKVGLFNSYSYWFNEAFATFRTKNGQVDKGTMNHFIDTTGKLPTGVELWEHSMEAREALGDGFSKEYDTYNTVLRYLVSQGATTNDFLYLYEKMDDINRVCYEDALNHYQSNPTLTALMPENANIANNIPYEDIGAGHSVCDSSPLPTAADLSYYNSLPATDSRRYELLNSLGWGSSYNGKSINHKQIFEAAFDEKMAPYGITLQYLNDNFQSLVIDGYL